MQGRRGAWWLAAGLLLVAVSPCTADTIWAEVADGRVTVYHLGAEYNCCWRLEAEVSTGAALIDLFEQRGEASEECDCICNFDLRFGFAAPAAGNYLLRVWAAVYPGQDPLLLGELVLEIPAQGAGPLLVDQSGCGGWVTGVPDPPTALAPSSFSAVRALY
jgi:hypothetical protein